MKDYRPPWHEASLHRGIASARAALAASWSFADWLEQLLWLASWDRWRAATPIYQRFEQHARELTISRIQSLNGNDLDRALQLLERTRANYTRRLLDRRSVWTADELGRLLVEARNRKLQLELGRNAPRAKGPAFDVTRLPLAAIERLIQRHKKLAVVEQLRAERNRRAAL